jgi:hypothetical protein
MAIPKPKTQTEIDIDNRLDYERTKMRLAQRIDYRQKHNEMVKRVLAEMQNGSFQRVLLEDNDEAS